MRAAHASLVCVTRRGGMEAIELRPEEPGASAELDAGIARTALDSHELALPPLVVLDRVEAFLDERGLGAGSLQARRIGVPGGSNFTFLLERDTGRYVLRRPPRPPLPPSAHDMVREARFQLALARQGIRVPSIVAVCEDEAVIGAPFYLMEYLEGDVIDDVLPPRLASDPHARRKVGLDLVDTLVEIHEADVSKPDLAVFSRPGSYAERQVRRFSELWPLNATRELPVPEVGERLRTTIPEARPARVVHGDYRLGNVMVGLGSARVVAVLDWEMGAIGDPRADLGYLVATYSEPGGAPNALGTSTSTATPGFPSGAELVARYEERSGATVDRLAWFEALALWKAAVFCEAIYGRYVRGELGEAPQGARFEEAVPRLVEAAAEALRRDERYRQRRGRLRTSR
jgi:aminoglycoside phosphotransferase (APT) family kinase protein